MLTARVKGHAVAGEIFPHATDSTYLSFTLPHEMNDITEHKSNRCTGEILSRKPGMALPFLVFSFLFLLLYSSIPNEARAVNIGWRFVVDDGDPGYSETGNSWASRAWSSAYNGDYRYLSHLNHTVERKGEAVWQLTIPTSGTYRIDIHYRPTENRTRDADYHVYDGRGEIHKHSIDQTYHGPLSSAGWYSLGNYDWSRGHRAKVVLDGSDDLDSDEADAVRWTLVRVNRKATAATPRNTAVIFRILLGNTTLQGSWIETGGFDRCNLKRTRLTTSFTYSRGHYKIVKNGVVQGDNCSLSLVENYARDLPSSAQTLTKYQFIILMKAVYSQASSISVSTFTTNGVSYIVNHPTKGRQRRYMVRR